MGKFCISAVLKSKVASRGYVLVFDTDDEMKPSYHGSVVNLDCERFVVDEVNSSKNWHNAFGFNLEPPRGALITANLGYFVGRVVPYFEWKNWCWWLSAPFLIKNRKLKENHYKKSYFY